MVINDEVRFEQMAFEMVELAGTGKILEYIYVKPLGEAGMQPCNEMETD